MSRRSRQKGTESQRQLRVGEAVRHALVDLLQRGSVHDPRIAEANLTVAEVRMSPDLRLGTVFVSALGDDRLSPELETALQRAVPFLRGEVARRVNLKYAPDLRFRQDESLAEAARIDALLAAERARFRPTDGDDDGAH
ncbi:MAG: 30S ribosome-binding factor RbfA [Geminicoccaceae bacterium]|nr:30S ribosome-binding factor RbfA [Geminicoccaceae bacterium]